VAWPEIFETRRKNVAAWRGSSFFMGGLRTARIDRRRATAGPARALIALIQNVAGFGAQRLCANQIDLRYVWQVWRIYGVGKRELKSPNNRATSKRSLAIKKGVSKAGTISYEAIV
jgi:hypothetical protein